MDSQPLTPAPQTAPTPEISGAADISGPFRITVHPSLAQAEPGWRRLQETGICYGFQTYEWLSAWQSLHGDPEGVLPAIVQVCAGTSEDPVMVVPLGVYRKHGLKILSFLGGWLTDYHAPLLSPHFAKSITPSAFRELWERVRGLLPAMDYIHFWRMPERVEDVPNPFVHMQGAVSNEFTHFSKLPPTYEEFLLRRSKKVNNISRRKRDNLQKIGPIVFSFATTPEEIATTMDALVRQKSRRHMETTSADPYASNPRLRQFYEQLLNTGKANPRGILSRVTVNGEVVATLWAFIHRKWFLSILSGFEVGKWGRYSPGVIMKEELIRWCIATGLDVFDLTVGDEAYKADWTEITMPVFVYHKPVTLLGAGYRAAILLRQTAKRALAPFRR